MPIDEYAELLKQQEHPPSTNPYDQLLAEMDQGATANLKSSIAQASKTNPDTKANATRIADRLKVPVEMVERNPEMFRQQDTAESFPYDDLIRKQPKLADWLATPTNSAIASDDVHHLSAFDRTIQIGENLLRAPTAGAYRGATAGLWGTIQAGADLTGFTNVSAYAARVAQASQQMAAGIRGPQTGATWWERAIYGGVESVGQSAIGLATSVLTGTPAPALVTMGLQTGGESYTQARAVPAAQRPSVPASLAFAASQGAVEVATELIPATLFLKDLAKHVGFMKTVAHQIATEVPGEQIATLLQDLNEWAVLRPTAPFSQYLAERPSAAAATLISTLVAAGTQSSIGIGTQRLVERLGTTAAASSTVKRSPEAAEDLLAHETKDGPLETVYVPFDAWTAYWQSKGLDPAQVAADITDNPQAFDPITKADIPIPTAKYVVRLAPTEHNAFFAGELRVAPEAPNARETEEFAAAVPTLADVETTAAVQTEPSVLVSEGALKSTDEAVMPPAVEGVELKTSLSPEGGLQPEPGVASEEVTRAAADAALGGIEPSGRVAPLFTDAATMGGDEEQFASYQRTVDAVATEARDRVQQLATRAAARQQTKRYQRARQTVQAAVRAEFHASPVYKARAAIVKGTNPDGSPLVEGQTPEPLKGQPREVVAEMFGFSSADELNQALTAIRGTTLKAAIQQETDRRMPLEYPELVMGPEQLAEASDAAYYGEGRSTVIAAELAALRATVPAPRVLKSLAEQRVREMRVRDLRPGLYLMATQRASQRAFTAFAENRRDAVITAKREELFSLAMYRATRDAKVTADKLVPWVQRHDTVRARAKIGKAGESNLEQWDGLLHQYEFKNVPQNVLDRRASLRNWMESQQALGLDIDLPARVLNESQRVNYRELTVEDLDSVRNGLRQVIQFSYFKFKLLDRKERRELKVLSTAVAERIYQTSKSDTPAARLTRSRGMLQFLKKHGKNTAASFLSPDTILRELDGWENLGPVYTHLKGGIDRAVVEQLLPRLRAAAERLTALNSVYKPRELQRREYIASLRDSLTKEEILAVALNWGSADNRAALLESKLFAALHANEATVQDILSHLHKRDWDYVQSIWDFKQTFWSEIAESQRRRKGIIPTQVEAMPVVTPFGAYPGGYYSLKYDPEGSILAKQDEIEQRLQAMRLGRYSAAMTRDGFAQERVGSGGRPVLLSLGVIASHVNEVIYDLSLGDPIRNSDRILRSKDVRDAFETTGNSDAHQALDLWLHDVATGEMVAADSVSKALRWIRTGFTGSALLFNIGTVLVQPTGIAQTFAVLPKRDALGGLVDLFTRPWVGSHNLFLQVTEASPFMASRQTTFNVSIVDAMSTIRGSTLIPEWVMKSGYYLMTKSQWILDVATWLGAHRQGLREFEGDTTKAVAFADRMVARAQASGLFSDRGQLERGTGFGARQSEFVKMWTMLGSYMFAKGNVFYEKTRKTNFRSPTQVLGYLVDLALMFTVEALLVGLLRGRFDEDEEESFAWALLKETVKSMFGTIPFIREGVSEIEGFRGGGPIGNVTKKVADFYLQAEQGDFDLALVKATDSVGGVLLHTPSTFMNRLIDASTRAEEGEDVTLMDYLITRQKPAAGQ